MALHWPDKTIGVHLIADDPYEPPAESREEPTRVAQYLFIAGLFAVGLGTLTYQIMRYQETVARIQQEQDGLKRFQKPSRQIEEIRRQFSPE